MIPRGFGRWLFALALGMGAVGYAHADANAYFQVLSAHTYARNMVFYLDATAEVRLDDKLDGALNNGVSLMFVYDVQVVHPGVWWWFDDVVAALSQRYRLRYRPLSQRYQVDNLNTGVSSSYARLDDALAQIERLQAFPMLDQSLLPAHENVRAEVRLRIDAADLPLPLRVRAYFNDAWRPASDWYRCALR